ncbi:glycosyltransferase family 39 protein [Paracoccus sp. S1E-3]|uniref:ArnT family glycosyltransferase n=1 Tax=Paracoccus sp. S1E-3 TaxID=2756130 RepID=UPI0015EE85BF|nr:glycosyltransferase family 39 protein [Paracoccus sp. S1E-3]MBA4491729.1 glycosyltransferase family 39 protein [Paracoccus sp. S1E-3]
MASSEAYLGPQGAASSVPSRSLYPAARDLILGARARAVLIAIAAAFVLLRLWAVFTVPFTDTTEARYAEIARKMVETGNWLTPQFDYGVPFWGKPPLHTWLSAAGMQLFGVNEAAARLPILLTALAVLALVWLWMRDLVGRNSALVATVALAITAMFFGASAFVMTDMPMVLGTTLVMVGFWNAVHGAANSRTWGYAMVVGLAIGLLAKGPVATILCGIPVLLWLVLTWNWRLLKRLPWLGGAALLLVLVVPWYTVAEIATPGFLRYFLIGEHVQRFLVPGWQGDLYGTGHAQPKGMIWIWWLIAALPWSVVPLLLLSRVRSTFGAFRGDRAGWRLYLLLWALSPLLLFTPASNILAAYVLPGLPAAVILMVVLATDVFGTAPGRLLGVGFVAASLVVLTLFTALAGMAVFAPAQIRLKSDKGLVAAAETALPGAPLYTVGRRSFSAEFYSRGRAKTISAENFAQMAAGAPAAFSVSPDMAPRAEGLGLQNLGAYGRHVLFLGPGKSEMN